MRTAITVLLAAWISLGAQNKDISGTWVAKQNSPMGEMEIVYELKVEKGRITGTQRMPFGDFPITGGKLEGDRFEMTVETEFFGNVQKRVVKGKIAGDALEVELAMPAPPPGMAQGGPGGGPQGAPFGSATVTARRGTPTPSNRAPGIDYNSLPKIALPSITELPRNGLSPTPPMGWSSWNKFGAKIDDKTIRSVADAMVASGMGDAGYTYVNIDDGWQGKRDESGVLQPNSGFPDMKALADYVHSKGLKLGIYSSPGPRTCGGFEGSYAHEELDARTWATWGIDYLKYDWCSASRIWKNEDMRAVYQKMGEALRATGRPMVYGLCQYGLAEVQKWGPSVGANLWRTTMDIQDRWTSMAEIGFSQSALAAFGGPGHWNDPDMLEVGNTHMTTLEYRTHFSLWAMLAAPLIAGNDVRNMSSETKEILLNREVIAINQDSLGQPARRLRKDGDTEVWSRPLAGGAYAIALFNRGQEDAEVSVRWSDLDRNRPRHLRDVWRHEDLGQITEQFTATVRSHGTVLIRIAP
ncbi:glycoside hydrolase family 27 protein [Paludibaculum fermentans]|uniref:Alpha-galactosidase n=1 Tax=Paludibaculum fermentans TaxID=1473598 RepID=A0A7S7NWL6_PALFE|nr:glycoside hydrolase family 27 protein [Paludibaculum fermentans]QOY90539.1 glycoside hydrolase family 27 protein [Paludibaculum fermentans]